MGCGLGQRGLPRKVWGEQSPEGSRDQSCVLSAPSRGQSWHQGFEALWGGEEGLAGQEQRTQPRRLEADQTGKQSSEAWGRGWVVARLT